MLDIQKICKDTSDDLAREYPHIKIFWGFVDEGNRERAFHGLKYALDMHPAGKVLLEHYEDSKNNIPEDATHIFLSDQLITTNYGRVKSTAICLFIHNQTDADPFEFHTNLLGHIYTIMSRLINNDGTPKNIPTHIVNYEQGQGGVAQDSFASFMMALSGNPEYIQTLAQHRMRECLSPSPHEESGNYLFPLVTDMVRVIYREKRSVYPSHGRLPSECLRESFILANMILKNLDESVVYSWNAFEHDAQIMAWAGYSPEQILGTAVFSCEDPFKRAHTYVAIDLLNVQTDLMTRFEFFNPFTNNETNARNHRILCQDYFDRLIMNFKIQENVKVFEEEISRQNDALLKGQMLGWCAPALMACVSYFKTHKEDIKNQPDMAQKRVEKIFYDVLEKTPWTSIKKAGIALIFERQKGKPVTFQTAIDVLQQLQK